MKKLAIAVGLLGLLATTASAQPVPAWEKGRHPYARQHHGVCIDKARRLHGYERRAERDGRLSRGERQTIAALQRDLDRTCGRFRWGR
ncbi:MAG: hypothetical protein AB7O57_09920 [Hyphomicrobiaceae bacterium]